MASNGDLEPPLDGSYITKRKEKSKPQTVGTPQATHEYIRKEMNSETLLGTPKYEHTSSVKDREIDASHKIKSEILDNADKIVRSKLGGVYPPKSEDYTFPVNVRWTKTPK